FFQAEDGIRDFHVTGVQTCALPISARCVMQHSYPTRGRYAHGLLHNAFETSSLPPGILERRYSNAPTPTSALHRGLGPRAGLFQIGRASCRARVWSAGVAVAASEEK